MDTTTFDTLARSVSTSLTRRSALRGLVAGAAVTVASAGLLLESEDGLARRRKRRKGKKGKKGKGKNQKLQPGERCQNDSQCVKGYICEVPVNGSNSDEYCSGGQGATCGAPNGDGDDTFPFCAVGFDCTPTGNGYTCQAVPDEF
ncbi:MAG: hypothetical protein R2853_09135 [Thermomicrobiales bacterium]